MMSEQTVSSAHPQGPVRDATAVPAQTHDEADRLARVEFERLLSVLESLHGDDWKQPTYCTLWTVREMVAHIAGSTATFSSFREFRRHCVTNPYRRDWPKPEDACNYMQITERAGKTSEELLREYRETGPKELQARYRLPWLVRNLPIPFSPPARVAYLTDTILTRDWWMHRVDLCHATGKAMELTPGHDGRITALVVRDVARNVRKHLGNSTVELLLTGPAGGGYRFGTGSVPEVVLEMDAIDFHLRASERIAAVEARKRTRVHGSEQLAERFLEVGTALY